jgi:hypothetical protein
MHGRDRADLKGCRAGRCPVEGLLRTYLASVVVIYLATQSVWTVAIASMVVAVVTVRVMPPRPGKRRG